MPDNQMLWKKDICWTCEDMGLDGRFVAEYAGSSKLLKRMSLIISGMIFGDMLDIAKWLRMRRKYQGRDLLLTTRLLGKLCKIAVKCSVLII